MFISYSACMTSTISTKGKVAGPNVSFVWIEVLVLNHSKLHYNPTSTYLLDLGFLYREFRPIDNF